MGVLASACDADQNADKKRVKKNFKGVGGIDSAAAIDALPPWRLLISHAGPHLRERSATENEVR
jgi:hypothetical protein